MPYAGVSHIIGQYEAQLAASNSTSEHSDSLDQDDFLTLLVAQLTHQDPLNPMEDTDITGQLAEFSSLEQLTNLNTKMGDLIDLTSEDSILNAVNFIGRWVTADGYNLSKTEDGISTLHYSLGEAVSNVTVYLYSNEGEIVRTEFLGSKQPGEYTFEWDGLDDNGNELPDGLYSVGVLAEDMDGQAVLVETQVSGLVEGVVSENGYQYLRLTDGRYVNMLNVYEVVENATPDAGDPADTGDGESEDPEDTGDGESEGEEETEA